MASKSMTYSSGNPSPYVKTKPVKPATQGFQGENAGGRGTFGTMNTAKNHTQPARADGNFGPTIGSGKASETYKRLLHKATGTKTCA